MLSFDIQVEIIKKLPVKSLLQFRSVCKAWKSLIDNPQFITGYHVGHDHLMIRYKDRSLEENDVKYICFVDDDTFPQQKFALISPHLVHGTTIEGTTILGSSHGLLCLTGYYRKSEKLMQIAVIWNPAIRKSIAVVVPNICKHQPFDSVLGFGACPDTKDPMLVKITSIKESWKMESIRSCISYQVMIFTLSSGKWTTSSCSNLPRKSIQFTCFQTNIGQFIYWLAHDWIAEEDGEYRNLIMSFDMSTKEFREIDLPDSLAAPREPRLFVSRLRESLAVVVVEHDDVSYRIDAWNWKQVCVVWIMEDGDFTKLFTINPPNASVWSTRGFRNSGEPIVEIQLLEDDKYVYDAQDELVVYDPSSKQIKDLGICGYKHSIIGSSYTESLLLLDHHDGHIVRCEEMTIGTRLN